MGSLRPVIYAKPETASEVSSILKKYRDEALIIGGGTTVYDLSERGFLGNIKVVIDLSRLGLDKVETNNEGISIGAYVTLARLQEYLARNNDEALACLKDALRDLGPPQVRNLATVGGAVAACIPFFDLPIALVSLDATVELMEGNTVRTVPVFSFQKDYLQPDLREGEFLARVIIPKQDGHTSSAFVKLAMNAGDWSIVNCSCTLKFSGKIIAGGMLVLGGVANRPFVAQNAMNSLIGKEPVEDVLDNAVAALEKELTEPPSDSKASGKYRKKVAKVIIKEALTKAIKRRVGGS